MKRFVKAVLASAVAPVLLLASAAQAGSVDFETIPNGTPRQGMVVRNRYLGEGVSFRLANGQAPRLVRTGRPGLGFWGFQDKLDVADPSQTQEIGSFFLVDGNRYGANPKPLIISFTQPAAPASGQILDVDRREAWRVTARDAAGQSLESIVITPQSPGAGNAKAATWSFSHAAADIASVRIKYVGRTRYQIGRGFDNLSWSAESEVGHPPPVDPPPVDPPPVDPPPVDPPPVDPPPIANPIPLPAMFWPAATVLVGLGGARLAARRRRSE